MAMLVSKHKLYETWCTMMKRCYNKNYYQWNIYGGRGIKVCARWHKSRNFIKDMEKTHKDGLQLDRINNDKGYSKENCRWADSFTQNNNRRNNRFLEYNNKKMTISQWSRFLGINRSTLAMRFYVYKWNIDRILGGGASL